MPIPHRIRSRLRLHGFSSTHHRACVPHSPSPHHRIVQHVSRDSSSVCAISDRYSTWYMGSIIAAWVTYGTFRLNNTWSWRIPSALQGLPSIVQILLVFWLVPESPRWLVSHGRIPEARAILLKWHCNGDETDPLIDFEMHEITEGIRLDQEIAQTTTYRSLFATPGNRRRMLAIIPYSFFSQWSGVSRRW